LYRVESIKKEQAALFDTVIVSAFRRWFKDDTTSVIFSTFYISLDAE
jgi:hypothetical protein